MDWVVEAFVGELPGAIMHAEAAGGVEVLVGQDGFGGVHVHAAHEPAGFIGTNGQQGKVRGTEAAVDFAEERAVGGIAGEEEGLVGIRQMETAPEAGVLGVAAAV